MIDFALMSDNELNKFVKVNKPKNLSNSDLIDLQYELSYPARTTTVPANVEKEIEKRNLDKI
ncbi:MAG: hypothetical protein GY827_04620 [Cytophagales bacterium]|nr:hypothetical protein [Cytophagales bacterium]